MMNDIERLAAIKTLRYAEDVFPQDIDFLYECLAGSSSRRVKAAAIQTLRYQQDKLEGAPILLGNYFVSVDLDAEDRGAFFLFVLDVFGIQGKGTCAVGFVVDGTIRPGQPLVLEKADGRDIQTVCNEVTSSNTLLIQRGSLVHVFIDGLTMGEVSQGDVLKKAVD